VLLVLLVVPLLDGSNELGELRLVFTTDLSEGKDGSSLLVDDCTKTGFTLDDGVWNTHLAAKGGEEDDEFNGIDVVGDEHQRRLLVLDQTDNMVETVLDSVRLLGNIFLLLTILDSLSLLGQTLLLLSLGLWAVFVEEAEGLGGSVLVESVLELSNCRGNLQTQVEDLLLALHANIFGPFDEPREVAFGLDVLADTEVSGALLDERVLLLLRSTRSASGERSSSDFLSLGRL